MNKANVVMVYRSGVNLTMSRKGHLTECWVSTQPITGTNNNGHAEKSLFSISTSINNTKGRDPEQKHLRMTSYNRGFTLIELLVVVLIIGILAAVALPQYQLARWKTEYRSIMNLTEKIAQAERIYYLEHGKYTNALTDLDIQTNIPGQIFLWTDALGSGVHVSMTMPTYSRFSYRRVIAGGGTKETTRAECLVQGIAKEWEKKYCHAMTGKTTGGQYSSYYAYF